MSLPNALFVGIDVSKETLDIAASSDIAQFTVSNDSDGFDAIIDELRKYPVALVLIEATGGLEAAVACSLQAEGLDGALSIPDRLVTLPTLWAIWQKRTVLMHGCLHKWLRSLIDIRGRNALSVPCRMRSVRFLLRW